MNLSYTLFGGAILIAVLFHALRLAGVANYWRGVMSAVLPTMAFFAYSMVRWPGGDVVAIHLTVYLATATVLTLLGIRKTGAARRLHWAPAAIIGFFAAVFAIQGVLLVISGQGVSPGVARWFLPNASQHAVHTAFPGVVPHDEAAAKTVSQYLNGVERQRRLGWKVELTGTERLRQNEPAEMVVTVEDGARQPVEHAAVSLNLLRPARAENDQTVNLVEVAPGRYRGQARLDRPGSWVAELRIALGQDRYETRQNIEVSAGR